MKHTKHKCLLFPSSLLVLRPSFGIRGVKTIINHENESFNRPDLLGQTSALSLFVSVDMND